MQYEFIKDRSLLIVPNNIKDDILKYLSKQNILIDYKIMSKEELKKKLLFDYNSNTILYMIKKYNIKPTIAHTYLENMYYLENKKYTSPKLNELNKMKQDLIENKLLIIDKLFKLYLKEKNVIVYGYDYIDNFFKKLLDQIEEYTHVQIIEKVHQQNKKHTVYEFDTIDEEIEFVATKIVELINSDIDINNIYLSNVTDEYNNVISRIFKFYNIPITIDKHKLSDTIITNEFINLLKTNKDLNTTINEISEKYNNTLENSNIINKIIDICNNYDNYVINDEFIETIEYDFNNSYIKEAILENKVGIIDIYNNIIDDEKYIFLLGFNQGVIPKVYKDEDYISDNLKSEVGLEDTTTKNKIEKQIVRNIINSIKNLTITYKLKTPFDEYYKSLLIDEDEMVVNRPKISLDKTYSNLQNKINLTKKLDNLVKYGTIDNDLPILYNSYKTIDYLTFDNKFSGINKNNLYEFLNNKLLLSYSSIDKFYRCKFRYYINSILKLEKYEETFPILIGNLFHYVLSVAFNTDFDFDMEWNNYLKDKELSYKEKFFIEKLKSELLFIIDTIKEQNKFSNLNKSYHEEKIYINKDKNIKITFMGIVDKIMYEEKEGKTIVAIIDYKTGNPETNLNNTIYGIEMQLPVYIYLVKNSKKLSNVKIAGFYLQKILNNEVIVKPGESQEKNKKDSLKLIGYSNSNEDILKEFDFSYKDSEVIKSMKVGKNGFYSYSKVINDEKIDALSNMVDKKIDEAIDEIINANFEIDPKRIDNKNIGCEFCNFKDICYVNEKDYKNLVSHKDLDFL